MHDDPNPMIEALRRLVAEERTYPLEAYCFLYQALDIAQRAAGERRHVSGHELLQGVRKLAIDLFGPLPFMVFNHWGLIETADFGKMVFHLVERELMGKTEEDKLEDFVGVFDFEEVLSRVNDGQFEKLQDCHPALKTAVRVYPASRSDSWYRTLHEADP